MSEEQPPPIHNSYPTSASHLLLRVILFSGIIAVIAVIVWFKSK